MDGKNCSGAYLFISLGGSGSFVRWYYLQCLVSFISCLFAGFNCQRLGLAVFIDFSGPFLICFVFGTFKYAPSYLIVRGNLKLKVA